MTHRFFYNTNETKREVKTMSGKNGKTSELFRHISEYIGSEWSSEGYEFGGTFPDSLNALFENKPGLYVIGARPANGKTTGKRRLF